MDSKVGASCKFGQLFSETISPRHGWPWVKWRAGIVRYPPGGDGLTSHAQRRLSIISLKKFNPYVITMMLKRNISRVFRGKPE